jgi:hypothetical protein
MDTAQPDVEFRVMPSGDGRWYWEVITQRNSVIKRGIADTEPTGMQTSRRRRARSSSHRVGRPPGRPVFRRVAAGIMPRAP